MTKVDWIILTVFLLLVGVVTRVSMAALSIPSTPNG